VVLGSGAETEHVTWEDDGGAVDMGYSSVELSALGIAVWREKRRKVGFGSKKKLSEVQLHRTVNISTECPISI
jgi:hypothetical protein